MINFVEELRWRGLLHTIMPDTEDYLLKNKTAGYIGFDPTADSLHIGSLVQIIILMHFQRAGHSSIALVGGATGMVGDPSGKSAERNLLDEETLAKNIAGIKNQLERFLDFDAASSENPAELVNNYDWMKDFSFLDFIRDVGKHITVNYMMAKDSVKKRLGVESKEGMSFTEFTYQLVQGYDFLHLYQNHNCSLQMGGSDQWGNITTGVDLTRRMEGENVQHIGATGVLQQRSSRFESHCVGFGGPLRRHDLQVRLEGEGAETKLNGVVVTQGKQHYDNHTSIDHVAAHCNSEETYRNIAADQSHAIFNGRIYIHQDAQKSNADMNNKNLLLSNGAEIDTKPELEIYADDVKCAHGATIGQLDETSVFYLVSRGIGRRQANVLLTMAFINELVQQIPVEAVRETAQARLNDFFEQTFQEA